MKKEGNNKLRTVAIILGGGTGNRFKAEMPKQFIRLSGRYVSEYTIDIFEKHPLIDDIYLVVHRDYQELMASIVKKNDYKKVKKILIAGTTRQESSAVGIFACGDDVGKVILHETVRPFVSEKIITSVINALDNYSAVETGSPHTEAVIKVMDDNIVTDIPPRENLYRGQTPQGFNLPVIREAHEHARKEGYKDAHCDVELILKYKTGGPIFLIRGSEYNIKITYPLDIYIADKILHLRSIESPDVNTDLLREKINGKVIVVFGGTSGIGLEICRICEELGGSVYGLSRRNNVDIRDIESISAALKDVHAKHKRIDHVVCSAAIVDVLTIEESNTDSILDQINTNLVGNIFVAKASIPYLVETKGSLLFFASSSYTRGRNEYCVYSASKAAMVNFVQGLSEELDCQGIRVNIINPESTDTPMRQRFFDDHDMSFLLEPSTVALAAAKVMTADITGSVIDVKKNMG